MARRSPFHRLVVNVLGRMIRALAAAKIPLGAAVSIAGGIAAAMLDERAVSSKRPTVDAIALRMAIAALRELARALRDEGRERDAQVVEFAVDRVVAPWIESGRAS